MPAGVTGGEDFALLARRLKDTGEVQLKRDLYNAIDRAARPLARQIANVEHLKEYMPDRYAEVLAADLAVTVSKRTGRDPGVKIRAKSRRGGKRRRVQFLDSGKIRHPVFGNPEVWRTQFGGMLPGFFTVPTRDAPPEVRDSILRAMNETARKVMKG